MEAEAARDDDDETPEPEDVVVAIDGGFMEELDVDLEATGPRITWLE